MSAEWKALHTRNNSLTIGVSEEEHDLGDS